MNFYIRRNSILPTLKMKLIFDGRNDYKRFHDLLENSVVTFSMKNVNNGVYKVANKEGKITKISNNDVDEYYVEYEWVVDDTNELGQFEGEFKIKFLDDCSHILVPIKENLYINVLTSFTKGDVEQNNNLIDGDGCLIYCEYDSFTGGTVSGNTTFLSGVTINGNLDLCNGELNVEIINGCSPVTIQNNLIIEENSLTGKTVYFDEIFSGGTNLNDIFLNKDENIISGELVGSDLILERENENQIIISGFTDFFTTGATLSGTTAIFNRNDGNNYTLDLSSLSGSTVTDLDFNCTGNTLSLEQSNRKNFSVDLSCLKSEIDSFSIDYNLREISIEQTNANQNDFSIDLNPLLSGFSTTDFFTTGATFNNSNKIATFNRNDGNSYTLNLSGLTLPDTYVTGFTYDNQNTFTINQNEGQSPLSVTMTDLTLNSFSANTLSGNTIFSGNTNLSTVINNIASQYSGNTFVTGGTFNQLTRNLTLNRNDSNNVIITGITDFFTTASTFNNTTKIATFNRNDGNSYTLNLSGLTLPDVFVSGGTFSSNTLTLNRTDGNNVVITGFTSGVTGTTGSVAFFGTGNTITQDNSNFFWDDTNNRLSLGTNTNTNSRLRILGANTGAGATSTFGLQVHDSTGTNNALVVRDDGRVGIGTSSPIGQLHLNGAFPNKVAMVLNATNFSFNNGNFIGFQNNGVDRGLIYIADSGSDALRGIKISNPTAVSEIMVATGNRGVTITNSGSFTNGNAFQSAVTNTLGTTTPITIYGADVSISPLGSTISHIQETNVVGRKNQLLHRFFTSTGVVAEYGGYGSELITNTNGSHSGDLFFNTANAGTFDERMRLKFNGNLLIGTTTDNPRAILNLTSTSKGVLVPRMITSERDAVSWVAGDAGMVIYNTTTNKHQGWNGTTWNDFY